jgi:hypothetical protein
MLPYNTALAGAERDEDIRFDAECGESADSTTSYMIDQCLHYGDSCVEKAQRRTARERKRAVNIIEAYTRQYLRGGAALSAAMIMELREKYGYEDIEELHDAIVSREWRLFDELVARSADVADCVDDEVE